MCQPGQCQAAAPRKPHAGGLLASVPAGSPPVGAAVPLRQKSPAPSASAHGECELDQVGWPGLGSPVGQATWTRALEGKPWPMEALHQAACRGGLLPEPECLDLCSQVMATQWGQEALAEVVK